MSRAPDPPVLEDEYFVVEFVIGIEALFKEGRELVAPRFTDAWRTGPKGSRDANERLLRVKIEVPMSMWLLPAIRGKIKSDLQEEYQMFMEEIQPGGE